MIFCNAIFKQVAYGVGYVYAACINIYYHNNESSDFLLSVACVAFWSSSAPPVVKNLLTQILPEWRPLNQSPPMSELIQLWST